MDNLFEINNLCMKFPVRGSFGKKSGEFVHALNGVDLDIKRGEILGLVGESGCGKSTLGRCVLDLVNPTAGNITYRGEDTSSFDKKKMKEFRKSAQIVFQNPYSSLNPKMRIYDILTEPLIVHGQKDKNKLKEAVLEVAELTSLSLNELNRYPHEFSGGQKQRISIARSLILKPEFIVADEPVSALDVSIQAQIINLLLELKERLNLTLLFISHDLSVIKYVSDRIAVMYLGEIVELADKDELFRSPNHPYTKALLSAIPSASRPGNKKILLEGDLPNPIYPPSGCKFNTRCPECFERCRHELPKKYEVSQTHYARCFLLEEEQKNPPSQEF